MLPMIFTYGPSELVTGTATRLCCTSGDRHVAFLISNSIFFSQILYSIALHRLIQAQLGIDACWLPASSCDFRFAFTIYTPYIYIYMYACVCVCVSRPLEYVTPTRSLDGKINQAYQATHKRSLQNPRARTLQRPFSKLLENPTIISRANTIFPMCSLCTKRKFYSQFHYLIINICCCKVTCFTSPD